MSDVFEKQYNKTAQEFHESYLNKEAHQSTEAFFDVISKGIISNITNKNVLDLGCGAADDAAFYTKKGFTYYGLDVSKEMCNLAQKNKHVAEVRNESFSRHVSYEAGKFGLVVSKYAMQTSKDIAPIYSEVFRMLDVNGYFIFLVVHPFRQFLEKKKERKDYYKKELIESVIFSGKITVIEPSHTLSEYINKDFLLKFSLVDIREGSDFPSSEQIGGGMYPTYLIIVARKK
ncbi:MAG: class I SAM-dependent methyltransferase [Patescibacteria group bacterium]